jgi:hypothetical protein
MKKTNVFLVAVLVLALGLALTGSAAAQDPSIDAGFTADCTGLTGYGTVPAGATYNWYVALRDAEGNMLYSQSGSVSGGASFDVLIEWDAPSGASYYWWEVYEMGVGCNYASGCLECFQYQGCTPGGWQGGNLSKLWDEPNDPQWPGGNNPYVHNTDFAPFFTATGTSVDDLSMFELVDKGGGKDPERKAARDLVAAYLNASHPGVDYPFDTTQLEEMWNAAVEANTDAAFMDLHNTLDDANKAGCPL